MKPKYCINVDWFQPMIVGQLVHYGHPLEAYTYDAGRVVLQKAKQGTKHFKYKYDVSVKGKAFARVFCEPRNPEILNPNFIQVELLNNVLYEDWVPDFQYFLKIMEWDVVNVSRLDVALDGQGFFDIYRQLEQGKIYKKGKASYQPRYEGNHRLTGYRFGSGASNKMIRCYCKTDELESSNKLYIREVWDKAGLDQVKPVQRLELVLRNDAIKKIENFDWTRLNDPTYLAGILRVSFKNFFDFTEVSDDTNSSRWKTVEFIDWDSIGCAFLRRLSTRQTNEVGRMKQTSKTLFWVYLATGKTIYADLSQEMAWNCNCLDWYINKMDEWRSQFNHNMGHNKDGLVKFDYLPLFETYREGEQVEIFNGSGIFESAKF